MILRPIVAAGLNVLFPGLSFFQTKSYRKVWLFFSGSIFLILSIRMLAFQLWIFYFLALLGIVLWLWMISESFITAFKYDPNKKLTVRWYVYALLIIYQIAFIAYIQPQVRIKHSLVEHFKVVSPNMSPSLVIGDHVSAVRTKKIKRNDIIVFIFPMDEKTHYLKRCTGMPGDSLKLMNGEIFINQKKINRDYPIQYSYLVESKELLSGKLFHKYGIKEYHQVWSDNNEKYKMYITKNQAEALRKDPFILNVDMMMMPENSPDYNCFPSELIGYKESMDPLTEHLEIKDSMLVVKSGFMSGNLPEIKKDRIFDWNSDYYGPIYIPAKGSTIQLDEPSLMIYQDVIINHEGWEDAEVVEGELFINGRKVDEYTFKQNYYFGMGDSWHNSLDSRYWGFIPENLLYGKIVYRYWSDELNRIGTM